MHVVVCVVFVRECILSGVCKLLFALCLLSFCLEVLYLLTYLVTLVVLIHRNGVHNIYI